MYNSMSGFIVLCRPSWDPAGLPVLAKRLLLRDGNADGLVETGRMDTLVFVDIFN